MNLILHIGTEKTGTTHLQNWLCSNKETLSTYGFAVNSSLGRGNNRKLAAFFQNSFDEFHKDHGISNLEEKRKFFDRFLPKLRREIERQSEKHHTYIISSEHLSSRLKHAKQIERLSNFLIPIFDEIKIVAYFRKQSDLRVSLYSTALRNGFASPLSDFQTDKNEDSIYYNYFWMLSLWERAFGYDALYPSIYNREKLVKNDIRYDFASKYLPEIMPFLSAFNPAETFVNESFSAEQAEMLYRLNAQLKSAETDQQIKRLLAEKDKILDMSCLKLPFKKPSDNIDFDSRFEHCNQQFFTHYFSYDTTF